MPGSSGRPLPARDLDHVLEHTHGVWEDLRRAHLFVTGGTGFVGRWMLESLLWANNRLDLRSTVTVLTRDPSWFDEAAPHVARHAAVTLHSGDVRSFSFPAETPTHVLHLATESGLRPSPVQSFRTSVEGTERVLKFAARSGTRKLLFTSSGAVYGSQPSDCDRLSEDYAGAPSTVDALAGYGHGKRAAEYLCAATAAETGIEAKIARCFAFVGPLLPLDSTFAIGNFIRDALFAAHIGVTGDGTARRSYLYAADLAVWLWTVLVAGQSSRPYNVGSERDLSVAEVAQRVASLVRPVVPVRIAATPAPGVPPSRYVPSTARAQAELRLETRIDLDDAISRTLRWYAP